jgi:molybdate transport system ATP-binding protein
MNQGKNLLITGASGSGKTILAKAITGKLFHTGSIDFFNDGKPAKPSIVFVQQHYHFKNLSNVNGFYYQQRFNSFDGDDALTVNQELSAICNTTDDAISNLLQQFDLTLRANEPLLHLSSGEHKRFQLVKALLKKPDVIIFDEPFTGLDVQTRAKLKTIINELASGGTTIFLISEAADAPKCITHILELDNGSVKSFAERKDFITPVHHSELFVANAPVEMPAVNFTKAVSFKNVSVSYGSNTILKNINWQVYQGEKWLVKGRNGAGKSTLLSLITGDNPQAYANDIYLFGKKRGSGESIWDIKKHIGYVSPELQWYFDISINCFDAIASGFFDTIGLFRTITTTQQTEVRNWLKYFEIENHSSHLLSLLPAGKQRLVLLARAMVKNPPVLILDEPCQGLDQHQKDHFLQFTDAICMDPNRTLIYVSHYASEIPACISKVLELENGNGKIYTYAPTKIPLETIHT